MPNIQRPSAEVLPDDRQILIDLSRRSGWRSELESGKSGRFFDGHFFSRQLHGDLHVHGQRAFELQNASNTLTLAPTFSVGVLLSGRVDLRINEQDQTVCANTPPQPQAFISLQALSTSWRRSMHRGRWVEKIVVSLPYAKLQSRLLSGASRDHSELFSHARLFRVWTASATLVNEARHLLEHHKTESIAELLQLESSALTFLSRGLEEGTQNSALTAPISPRPSAEGLRIKAHLEVGVLAEAGKLKPNLDQVASAVGMSLSRLQRVFRRDFNCGIFEYVRQRKLQAARLALLQGDSIGEAAYLAGYAHHTNFCKAFKETFGESAGEVRRAKLR